MRCDADEILQAWVEKARHDPAVIEAISRPRVWRDPESMIRAVLDAVADDLPTAQPTVDRDALADTLMSALIDRAPSGRLWIHTEDLHPLRKYLADAILASDVVQDAAAVRAQARRAVAEEIATAIEARRPHIPVSTDPKRRERVVERSTRNRDARIAREAGASDA